MTEPPAESPRQLVDVPLCEARLPIETNVLALERLFAEHHDWPGCIVMDASRIAGIVSRKRLAAALSRRFARDLFAKGTLAKLLDVGIIDADPLIFESSTSVLDCVQTALARSPEMAYEPVIVMLADRPVLAEVDLLMRVQSALLQEALASKDMLLTEVQRGSERLQGALKSLEETRDRLLASEQRLEGEVAKRTLELARSNADLQEKQTQINDELEVARTLQQSILPADFPTDARFEGHAIMRAARMIGGDFYDVFALDPDHLGVVVADVSGKGVPAALFMMLVRSLLQEVARHANSAAECLARVNTLLQERNQVSLFVTMVYGILDVRTGRFTFSNGGHQMPYLLRDGETPRTMTERASPLVGLLDGVSYQEHRIDLIPGDSLLLMTDGVAECFDRSGQTFGSHRILELLSRLDYSHAGTMIEQIMTSLDTFSAGTAPSDDVTILVLRYLGNKNC